MKAKSLHVFMNGLLVGQLQKLANGGLAFTYTQDWLATPGARPISLSLPISKKQYSGDRVYNFFDNLLPDNDVIKTRIQALLKIPSKQPFDLLSRIGHDCVGAIQLSQDDRVADVRTIAVEPLNERQIAILLRGYKQAPLGMSRDIEDFRISIAGAQEKTALFFRDNQWYQPLGTTPTSHIFKLPIGFIEHQQIDLSSSCENEWLCYKIAQAFGLDVASSEISYFEDVKVLVVTRFDRKFSADGSWLMRLPQEDMCQALGYSPALKYQVDGGPGIKEIMSLLLGSQHPNADRERFFRQQMVFWLLAAIDGHAKNFSVFIKAGGRFQPTPLYDILSAYPLLHNKSLHKQKIKMAMALRSTNNHYDWYNSQYRYFLSTAKSVEFSVEKAEEILDEMLQQIEAVIDKVAAQLDPHFPMTIAEPIFAGMRYYRDHLR